MELDTLLKIFIIVVGLAVLAQAAMLVGIYLSVGRLTRQVEGVRAEMKIQLDPVTTNLTEILATSRSSIDKVATSLAQLAEITRDRVGHIDDFVEEVTDKARLQVLRIDHMVQDTLERIEDTTRLVQRNLLTPIHEATALIRGIRTGFEYLFGRRTGQPAGESGSGSEEQLFI